MTGVQSVKLMSSVMHAKAADDAEPLSPAAYKGPAAI
jgi:hypothetical protein